MFVKVFTATLRMLSLLSAPLGTSLNVKSIPRFSAVNPAEERNRFRQLSGVCSVPRNTPGRKWPTKAPTFTTQ